MKATTARPTALPIEPGDIPDELKGRSQWVGWTYERDERGKWTKVPRDPRTGWKASKTDPRAWGAFAEALAFYREQRGDGIGYVVTANDGLTGVDLDKCRDPQTGAIAVGTLDIIRQLDSYTEISPSGTGVRIFVKGKLPPGRRKEPRRGIEMYDDKWYFTLTGHHLPGTPTTIKERQEELTRLHARVFPAPQRERVGANGADHTGANGHAGGGEERFTDDEVLERAAAARNGDKFRLLWAGQWQEAGDYPSPSEADQALCSLLTFWTQDPRQIDRLFRRSSLYREEKWDREDYRERTIVKALRRGAFYACEDNVQDDEQARPAIPYEETPRGLVWLKRTRDGEATVMLTNFTARIEEDIIEDDGAERRRQLALVARLHGRERRFTIPAQQFAPMGWAVEQLGAGAIVSAGQGAKDRAREAIQHLSGDVPERRTYAHTGWREHEGRWVYLHAGGAIGAAGAVPDIAVALPGALGSYLLPAPPEGEALREAIRASLMVLDLGPDQLTVPVLAAPYRAVLGGADLSLYLAGPSGVFKSELAALAQQHHGAGLDRLHLPGAWSSTDNALEALNFLAKDALVVIDDFAPTGTTADVQRLHQKADRVLRGLGNRQGRGRLNADTRLRPARPPRSMVLSTGEDVPRGTSLRARLLILEVAPGDIRKEVLDGCQQDAREGRYAAALAGFVRWLAPRYEEIRRGLEDVTVELRQRAGGGKHRRTPANVAALGVGWRYFLDYARGAGAVTADAADALWRRGWEALHEAAAAQGQHQQAEEPARHFIQLLGSAITSGGAYVEGLNHELPDVTRSPNNPRTWGWRGEETSEGIKWRPQGRRVGWLDNDENLYLDRDAAFAAAQEIGQRIGGPLAVASTTLAKRLRERGLLASTDEARQTLTVRRVIDGIRRDVLHVRAGSLLCEKPDQPDQPDQNP